MPSPDNEVYLQSTIDRLKERHTIDLAQLEKCYERTRKNARFLKWLGWFPTSFLVRDAQKNLDVATKKLEEADAEVVKLLAEYGVMV